MLKSMVHRLGLAATTVLLGGLLSATLVRYAPGFGVDERELDTRLSNQSIAAIRNATAPERSIVPFYLSYLGRVLRGDLGVSRSLNRPVTELLAERAGVTGRLAGKALLIAWLMAVLLVLAAWLLRLSAFAIAGTLLSGAFLCVPAGALALLAVILNAPGYVALALIVFPKVHRYLADLTTATAGMAHIVTAKAKGLSRTRILAWHVIPVIRREVLALAGISISLAISAAIPVEALCGIPGIGQLAWQSALARDLPLLINISMLVIAFVTLANSGSDLLAEERRQSS
jgi:peptide/nickel transport system permease protein